MRNGLAWARVVRLGLRPRFQVRRVVGFLCHGDRPHVLGKFWNELRVHPLGLGKTDLVCTPPIWFAHVRLDPLATRPVTEHKQGPFVDKSKHGRPRVVIRHGEMGKYKRVPSANVIDRKAWPRHARRHALFGGYGGGHGGALLSAQPFAPPPPLLSFPSDDVSTKQKNSRRFPKVCTIALTPCTCTPVRKWIFKKCELQPEGEALNPTWCVGASRPWVVLNPMGLPLETLPNRAQHR